MSYKADDINVKYEFELQASDIDLKDYIPSLISGDESYCKSRVFTSTDYFLAPNTFTSTLLFFEDLYLAGQKLYPISDKLSLLKKLLHEINKSLPSCVYVPFHKGNDFCLL